MDTTLFQYCQKLIILSADKTKVLLAKRKGEADYDGIYSFIGGKMETTDGCRLPSSKPLNQKLLTFPSMYAGQKAN
jgi:hypothetical protein